MFLARLAAVAITAADRGVAYEPAAGTTAFVEAAQAIAAGLDHFAAFRVAAGAGHADALLGHLVLALPHHEVAAVDCDAVPGRIATAHAAGQHAAQVLHHAA